MAKRPGHIRIIEVSHRYKARAPLTLERLTLDIRPGQRVALLGQSGCGKSTLLRIISGLLKPSAGYVEIDGMKVVAPSPRWNLMFQKSLLLPWLSVEQNIALGLRFAGRGREATMRVAYLLEMVGLQGYGKRPPTELSGGQQQRVALARSLATDPQVLLLDEPYASLDPITRAALRTEVKGIVENLGLTLLLVTHDVEDALDVAERVIIMSPNPGRFTTDLSVAATPQANFRSSLLGYLEEGAVTAA